MRQVCLTRWSQIWI